jgi:hypothetical protein
MWTCPDNISFTVEALGVQFRMHLKKYGRQIVPDRQLSEMMESIDQLDAVYDCNDAGKSEENFLQEAGPDPDVGVSAQEVQMRFQEEALQNADLHQHQHARSHLLLQLRSAHVVVVTDTQLTLASPNIALTVPSFPHSLLRNTKRASLPQ